MSGKSDWQAIDEEPPLRQAVAGVFALVSVADGEVVTREVARFEQWLGERSGDPAVKRQAMTEFHEMCGELEEDYAAGAKAIKDKMSGLAGDPMHCQLLLSAARAAVVADRRIDDREEVTLREICELLGLDPDEG